MIALDDIRAARARIAPYIRQTPTLPYARTRGSDFGGDVTLKLELLQAAGSFKARGAMNRPCLHPATGPCAE